MLDLCIILFVRKGTCTEIRSQNNMISQQIRSSKHLLVGLALSLFSLAALANEDPASFLKFSTDFDAKCVTRGGVMIYTVVALKKGYEQPNFACDFSLPYDVNVGLLR